MVKTRKNALQISNSPLVLNPKLLVRMSGPFLPWRPHKHLQSKEMTPSDLVKQLVIE